MKRPAYPPPRWQTPLPRGVAGSLGPDVAAYARRRLGVTFDRWQRVGLDRALVVDARGDLIHDAYLLSAARQNGKTAIARSVLGWALTDPSSPASWRLLMGLAHDATQARIPYEAVRADLAPLVPAYPGLLNLTRYLGIRSRVLGGERSYLTGTREARNALRGYTVDLALFDEVRTQRDWETYAAIAPTMTARPDPFLLALSTAGDDRSIVLRALFDRGVRVASGDEPPGGLGMSWWALPEGADHRDERAWPAANPALAAGRLGVSTLRAALATMPEDVWLREHGNLWTSGSEEWLPAGTWARTAAAHPADRTRVVLGVEVVPTWHRASILAAIATDAGAWVGVVGEVAPSTGALSPAQLVAAVAQAYADWRPQAIAYSSAAAAAPHVAAWCEASDVVAIALHGGQLRAASELFRAELVGGRLGHADDPLMAAQVRAARPSGSLSAGGWYFSLRLSTGDIDALRAAAWAAWALLAPEEPSAVPQLFL